MGGGKKCMVVNCKSKRSAKSPKTSFHEIPVDPNRRKLWFEMLKPYIDPLEQKEITYVCGKHFEEKCFKSSKNRLLLRTAVPTIFNMNDSTAQVDPLSNDNLMEQDVTKEEEEGGEENTISSTNGSETTQQATKIVGNEATSARKYVFNSVKIYNGNGREEVCRICFKEAYKHKKLTDNHCTRIESYKEMLEYLSFGINLDFYPDPVICLNCIMMLLNVYDFKKKCLKTEAVLQEYQSSRISTEKTTNIIIISKQKRTEPTTTDEITTEPIDSPPSKNNGSSPPAKNKSSPSKNDPSTVSPPPENDRSVPKMHDYRKRRIALKRMKAPEIRGDPPYLCQDCGHFFLNWRQCRRHLRNHRLKRETVESFTCEICKSTFKNVNVAEHMDTHKRKKYKCVHCDRQFDRVNLLATHMKAKHERSPYATCDVCGKTCPRKLLTTHVAKHFDEKDAECPICGKMYYRWYLKKHVDTHKGGGGKKSVCHVCGKSMTAKYMNAHLKTHREVPKFKCKVCDITFRTKCELDIHSARKIHLRNVMLDVVAKSAEKNQDGD